MAHEDAASPLAVILTVLAVAIVVTGVVSWALFAGPDPQIVLQPDETGQRIEVTSTAADLRWEELELTLVDRGGFDRSGLLQVPEGPVRKGQTITLTAQPQAGNYLLSVVLDGTEIERVILTF